MSRPNFDFLKILPMLAVGWAFVSADRPAYQFIWDSLGKEAYLPEKSDGLQRDFEMDGTARLQRLGNRQAHQRLPDGRPLLAAIQRRGNLRGHHARTSQKDHE